MVETALGFIPQPYRAVAIRHRELLKFAMVGGTTWVIDTAIFLILKSTLLEPKPTTAKVISTVIATIVSYGLNRGWSFRTRGGRERHHETVLYVLVSAISVGVYAAPVWVSRYMLDLRTPTVTLFTEHLADLISGQVVGVLLGMAFRWWAFRRWVFPHEDARRRPAPVAKH